jgi:hypothetical protein
MDAYLLHVLDGRLRIKVPGIKHAPLKVAEVVHTLRRQQGVTTVHASPVTGTVLVLFVSHIIGPVQILQTLQRLECSPPVSSATVEDGALQRIGQKLAETLIQSLCERAIQRVFMALM